MGIYRYRKHVRWFHIAVPSSLALLGTALAIWVAYRGSAWGIVVGLLLCLEALIIDVILGRLAGAEIVIDDHHVCRRASYDSVEIPFDAIDRVEFSFTRYGGGWLKIVSGSTSFRVTVVLENITLFLKELYERLGNGRTKYSKSRFFGFLRTAAYSDQSWERIYEHPRALVGLGSAAATLGVAGSLVAERSSSPIAMAVVWGTLAFGGFGATWSAIELLLARRFAKACKHESLVMPSRDKAFERRVYRWALILGGMGLTSALGTAVLLRAA